MNDLQKAEFDMLAEVVKICDKLNIQYFMVCGSALGTAKYKGFISWDDDIDIGMMRIDYDKFLECAPKYLEEKYFLQSYHTDRYYPYTFLKIRDSHTTFIEKSMSKIDMNHGVYIDVFPLDNYPARALDQKILEMQKWIYSHLAATIFNNKRSKPGEILRRINVLFGCDKRTNKAVEKYEKSIAYFKGEKSETICNHANWQGKLEYAPKSQYGGGTWATFEGLKVRIPEKYDEYLTQKYGDWRADLPPEQQVGHHYAEVIDLNRPYTDYIVKLTNGKIRLKTSAELLKDGITPPENYKY